MSKRSAAGRTDSSKSDGEVPSVSGESSGSRVDRRKRRSVDRNEPSRSVDPDEEVASDLTEVDFAASTALAIASHPKITPTNYHEKKRFREKSIPKAPPAIPNYEDLEQCSIYKMDNDKRGIALIFNYENFKGDNIKKREGAAKDGKLLCDTLKDIGFDVRLHYDKKLDETKKLIDIVAKEDHSSHDCLLVTIMTHGKDNGILHATDGTFTVEDVIEQFKPDKVPSLAGKPKLFIFQACRGTKPEKFVTLLKNAEASGKTVADDPERARYFSLPTSADFLYVFSSTEGNVCFRDLTEGSWLIQDLCKELKKDAHTKDFVSILTNTLRRVALTRYSTTEELLFSGKQQMPVFMSTLTKFLYFFHH